MSEQFILSCESTVDLPYSYVESRNLPVLFYTYTVDGKEYPDDMGRNPTALPRFYQFLANGKLPSTTQINTYSYEKFFDELLQKGDVLHIAFGSGMTPSVRNAEAAAELLRQSHPDRKLIVLDSYCSSSGYGLLVDYAADLRDRGDSIEDVVAWVTAHRKSVHHQFFSTELSHYRRSGRMSGPAAAVATILNICPIMRLDDLGRIQAYDKVRGKKKAMERTVEVMERHAVHSVAYDGKCMISYSNCPEEAEQMKMLIESRFSALAGKIKLCEIGTIIASHCGPGTVAVYFLGDERAPAGMPV